MPDSADERLLFTMQASSHLTEKLGISDKVLTADVRSLAWSWENIADSGVEPRSRALLTTLLAIVSSYLRGHGLRMGNHRGFERHQITLSVLTVYVVYEVVSGGKYLFSALHRAGVTSMEDFYRNTMMGPTVEPNIIEQARQILREGGDR